MSQELLLIKIHKNPMFFIEMAAMILEVCKKTLRRWEKKMKKNQNLFYSSPTNVPINPKIPPSVVQIAPYPK